MTTSEETTNVVGSTVDDMIATSAKSGSSRLPNMPPSHYTPPKSMPEIITSEHETAIARVAEHFAGAEYKLEGAALSEDEMIWLSRETFGRYLVGTKFDLKATISRIEKSLIWRRVNKVYDVEAMAKEVEPEALTGKQQLLGFATGSQPILYLLPSRNDTPPGQLAVTHTIYMMERTMDLMPGGVTKLSLIIDFAGKRKYGPNLSVYKQVLYILQDQYPERLGRAIFLSIPWILNSLLNMLFALLDPVTRAKIRFNPDLVKEEIVTPDSLWKNYGGDIDFEYNHSIDYPLLLSTCLERREANRQRWRALGPPAVGRSEIEFCEPWCSARQ